MGERLILWGMGCGDGVVDGLIGAWDMGCGDRVVHAGGGERGMDGYHENQ